MTNFIHAQVEVGPGLFMTVDGNSKITAGNGTYLEPSPNAFSLPHISTCPGSTEICRSSCYVHGIPGHIRQTYQDNERVLHRVLMCSASAWTAADMLGSWIARNCQGGFRWHVSGDVMHSRHANWIVDVCKVAKDVPFWIYTRSLGLVGTLLGRPNLVVNVSADVENWREAQTVARNLGVRLCYLTHDGSLPDLPLGSVIFPDYALRGRDLAYPRESPWWQGLTMVERRMVCSADFFGQSEENRCGPCSKCLK